MRRYGIAWHVVEREWTYAQFRYVMRGIRLNNAAEAAAMEEARGGGPGAMDKGRGIGGAGRPLDAAEAAAVSQFLPASMVAEAVVTG